MMGDDTYLYQDGEHLFYCPKTNKFTIVKIMGPFILNDYGIGRRPTRKHSVYIGEL